LYSCFLAVTRHSLEILDCPFLAHNSHSFFNLEIISAREKADIGDHAAKGLEKKPSVDAIFKAHCAQKSITDSALLTSTNLEKPP
jgi:hypothetical protein